MTMNFHRKRASAGARSDEKQACRRLQEVRGGEGNPAVEDGEGPARMFQETGPRIEYSTGAIFDDEEATTWVETAEATSAASDESGTESGTEDQVSRALFISRWNSSPCEPLRNIDNLDTL
ncbi:hypothetical protein DFH07DRAFT_1065064 [Mycena maculata]|uniref:Uncharacterized protein n=1 Tax=Mycena maculata TaxID=230809 RepID=A0AAD7I6X1_9AGAR|nr:hypothetical protein DFH07DRAFT_1065064 [Mycena maculata]